MIAAVPWTLTVRAGPRVERLRFEQREQALEGLEARAEEFAAEAPKEPLDARIKRYEPVQQVYARIEVAGPQRVFPSVVGGVDVRGDGSVEAFRGRVSRKLIEQRPGESSYAALRRALAPS
jgi:hypothetical protein